MSHDPFATLEEAVAAVERTVADAAKKPAAGPPPADIASVPPDSADIDRRAAADADDRIAALEAERAAIRERLQRVRQRLLAAAQTSQETPVP
ncbi:MAG: hypothetical protein GKS06_16430 [Acidobacteria bacterium]|nr:hypothetical protein [Acidobacteriota bacterium]